MGAEKRRAKREKSSHQKLMTAFSRLRCVLRRVEQYPKRMRQSVSDWVQAYYTVSPVLFVKPV